MAQSFWTAVSALLDEERNGIGSARGLARALHKLDARQSADSWYRTLKRYAAGASPSERTAALIARAFDLSRDELPPLARPSLSSLNEGLIQLEERTTNRIESLATRLQSLEEIAYRTESLVAKLILELERDDQSSAGGLPPPLQARLAQLRRDSEVRAQP